MARNEIEYLKHLTSIQILWKHQELNFKLQNKQNSIYIISAVSDVEFTKFYIKNTAL